jgi:hypothetical protein
MEVWFTFFEFELDGPVGRPLLTIMAIWCALNVKKGSPNDHFYLYWAVTSDQITQQNSLQRAGGPKGSTGTLRPDFLT